MPFNESVLMCRAMNRFVAAIAVVMTFLLVPSVHASATTKPSNQSPLPTVDTKATPPGWVPVDYGDAQISVQANWVIAKAACAGAAAFRADGFVGLTGVTASQFCPEHTELPPNDVYLGPGSTYTHLPTKRTTVNGLTVVQEGVSGREATYVVAALNVTIQLVGPISGEVIHSLTYSPRAVALAGGSPPPIPRSWHRVDFGGLSVAVPSTWPTLTGRWEGGCNDTVLLAPNQQSAVTTDAGTADLGPPSCPSSAFLKIQKPRDGLVIDPGPYGPIPTDATFGPCMTVNHMSVCPTTSNAYYPVVPATSDVGGVLVAAVNVPGRFRSIAIEIGLGGNGMTARTILLSLRTDDRQAVGPR
jgi:hypothetical protein